MSKSHGAVFDGCVNGLLAHVDLHAREHLRCVAGWRARSALRGEAHVGHRMRHRHRRVPSSVSRPIRVPCSSHRVPSRVRPSPSSRRVAPSSSGQNVSPDKVGTSMGIWGIWGCVGSTVAAVLTPTVFEACGASTAYGLHLPSSRQWLPCSCSSSSASRRRCAVAVEAQDAVTQPDDLAIHHVGA